MLRDADDVAAAVKRSRALCPASISCTPVMRAGRHPVAGLQRSRAARVEREQEAQRFERPARRDAAVTAAGAHAVDERLALPFLDGPCCASREARGRRSGLRCCRSRRRSRSGPRSLIVASGLPAVSTPTCTAVTRSSASARVHSVFPAARRDRARSRNSASTAANPPTNTGKRRLPGVAAHAAAEDRPGEPVLLEGRTRARPMSPTFQPATRPATARSRPPGTAYAVARSAASGPGNSEQRCRSCGRRPADARSRPSASTVGPPSLRALIPLWSDSSRRSRVWETGVIINILGRAGRCREPRGTSTSEECTDDYDASAAARRAFRSRRAGIGARAPRRAGAPIRVLAFPGAVGWAATHPRRPRRANHSASPRSPAKAAARCAPRSRPTEPRIIVFEVGGVIDLEHADAADHVAERHDRGPDGAIARHHADPRRHRRARPTT